MCISMSRACCCLVLYPRSGKLRSLASEHLLDLVHFPFFEAYTQGL